jgi:hypothetical protein
VTIHKFETPRPFEVKNDRAKLATDPREAFFLRSTAHEY